MRFIDEVKIKVLSGKGGNGCASFRREKFIEFGGYLTEEMEAMVARFSLKQPKILIRLFTFVERKNLRREMGKMEWDAKERALMERT